MLAIVFKIMFHPDGKRSITPVPASIQHIVVYQNSETLYAVRRQLPSTSGSDPYSKYPHFSAHLYRAALSKNLEVVRPEWVFSHYARWMIDPEQVVVLILSHVSSVAQPHLSFG